MRQEGDFLIYDDFDYKIDNSKVCNNCMWSNDLSIRKDAFRCKIHSGKEYYICPHCHQQNFTYLSLSWIEMFPLVELSPDPNLIFSMDKLKQENIIDFNIKINQFYQQYREMCDTLQSQQSVPRCPTCGSTNIRKISGTKRWVGTGMFGLASSDLGKTMQCGSCGYKW